MTLPSGYHAGRDDGLTACALDLAHHATLSHSSCLSPSSEETYDSQAIDVYRIVAFGRLLLLKDGAAEQSSRLRRIISAS